MCRKKPCKLLYQLLRHTEEQNITCLCACVSVLKPLWADGVCLYSCDHSDQQRATMRSLFRTQILNSCTTKERLYSKMTILSSFDIFVLFIYFIMHFYVLFVRLGVYTNFMIRLKKMYSVPILIKYRSTSLFFLKDKKLMHWSHL